MGEYFPKFQKIVAILPSGTGGPENKVISETSENTLQPTQRTSHKISVICSITARI
jgi:hypothetical protein